MKMKTSNYARFSIHFLKHWTGLNTIPPLVEPVPVGALVPQFYGYYKSDPADVEKIGYLQSDSSVRKMWRSH
jgi:hypothetical protein